MNLACPLCLDGGCDTLEVLRCDQIAKLYVNKLGIDVANEFDALDQITFNRCRNCDLQFFHPPRPGGELFYEKLQTFPWYYFDNKLEYQYASSLIGQTMQVLEVGCGVGAFADRLTTSNYTGLELSQAAVDVASAKGLTVLHETIEHHAHAHSNSYDIVCAFQVLEHIANTNDFIQACTDCLKPGGLLIYSVPSADSFVSVLANNPLNMPPHHASWWTDECLCFLETHYNMKVVEIRHEPLEVVHRRTCATYMIIESLRDVFGVPL